MSANLNLRRKKINNTNTLPYMLMLKNALPAIFFFFCLCGDAFAQLQDPRLGISVKPIIPSGLFDNLSLDEEQNGVAFSLQPQPGYSAGVVLRQDLPYLLSFETGIYYVRRIYDIVISENETSTRNTFRFVNYEIPITGLIYIRLSENAYLNTTFGTSVDFFPNDVYTENDLYKQKAQRNYWVLPALIADVGAEYRTEKYGNFYIGGAYHRMLMRMAGTLIGYDNNGIEENITMPLSGHYFALNFKYFFPTQRTAPINFD